MNLPRYLEYKCSGSQWLREVPASWDVVRLKEVAVIVMGQSPSADDCNEDGIGQPFLQGNADFGVTFPAPRSYCDNAAKFAVDGDVLFSVRAPVGAINVADRTYGIGRGLCAIRAFDTVNSNFLRWMMTLGKSELLSVATGSTYEAVTVDQVASIKLLRPSLAEQAVIAKFLEQEVAKIDTLITKQQRLIALLAEKRHAAIASAVTQGVATGDSTKEANMEWLDSAPEHWERGAVKRWFTTTSGGTPDTSRQDDYYTEEGGYPWVRTTDLANEEITSCPIAITDAAIQDTACTMLPENSVLLAMYGGEGTIGKNGLLAFRACVNQAICALLPNDRFIPRFTWRYIQFLKPYWMIGAESSRKDPNISQQAIRNMHILRPPLVEQQRISDFLDSQLKKFDQLSLAAGKIIDLLIERRSALIIAAVTGQIDVRNSISKTAIPRKSLHQTPLEKQLPHSK